jgi:two-component system NarL family sensor kinase
VLFAAVDNFYRTSLAVLSVAVVAAVTFGVFSGRQILQPVLDLQRKASDFARGKRLPPAPDPLPLYELGTLTETFHEMAGELEQQRQQKRELIKKLINAQEEERKLVAYDLHDGLIQQLVGARMYFSMLQESLCADDNVTDRFEHGCEALTEAVVEGRRIIQGLHPTILDDLGLVDAVAELAQQMAARRTWELSLDIETLPHEPDKSVSVTVFRIVQEALNNAGKHAEANRVCVSLRHDDGSLHISVTDDGTGFDMQAVSERQPSHGENGFGISTMRERASLINGHCEIHSVPGEGTTVYITLPCHLPDALITD